MGSSIVSQSGQDSYDVIWILEQDACSSSSFAMRGFIVSTIVQLSLVNAKIVERNAN